MRARDASTVWWRGKTGFRNRAQIEQRAVGNLPSNYL